jgi:hypothetical protein
LFSDVEHFKSADLPFHLGQKRVEPSLVKPGHHLALPDNPEDVLVQDALFLIPDMGTKTHDLPRPSEENVSTLPQVLWREPKRAATVS